MFFAKKQLNRLLLLALSASLLLSALSFVFFIRFYLDSSEEQLAQWFPRFGHVIYQLLTIYGGFLQWAWLIILSLFASLLFVHRKKISHSTRIALTEKRKELLIVVTAILLSILISEFALRAAGYVPGKHTYTNWYNEVDTLINLKGRMADEHGITLIDTSIREPLHRYMLECQKAKRVLDVPFSADEFAVEIPVTAQVTAPLAAGLSNSPLANLINAWNDEYPDSLDEWQRAILEYAVSPINEIGFRSIDFKHHSTRKKILLIGDSFVYGYSAEDFSHCFADLLLADGYEVYNSGISGTDPPQYAAVARKYIPLLKPDFVIVNCYLGNDVMYYDEPVEPFRKSHFATNSADFSSSPYGIRFDNSKAIYDFINSCCYIPANNWFNAVCSKSCIGTIFWRAVQKIKGLNPYNDRIVAFQKMVGAKKSDVPFTNRYISEIKSISAENGATCVITCIPQSDDRQLIYPGHFENLFPDVTYYTPDNLTLNDYKKGADTHFNNEGHYKYYRFLTAILDSLQQAHIKTGSLTE